MLHLRRAMPNADIRRFYAGMTDVRGGRAGGDEPRPASNASLPGKSARISSQVMAAPGMALHQRVTPLTAHATISGHFWQSPGVIGPGQPGMSSAMAIIWPACPVAGAAKAGKGGRISPMTTKIARSRWWRIGIFTLDTSHKFAKVERGRASQSRQICFAERTGQGRLALKTDDRRGRGRCKHGAAGPPQADDEQHAGPVQGFLGKAIVCFHRRAWRLRL